MCLIHVRSAGLNEIPNISHLAQFVSEINEMTKPANASSHSLWIVSSRKFDYKHFGQGVLLLPLPLPRCARGADTAVCSVALDHLERRTWELQPLMFGACRLCCHAL
jgi:hypothetical protein